MASSENLMAMEKSWPPFRSTLSDSWFFDIFSNKETEALTKALKKSFTNPSIDDDSSHDFSTGTVESFLVIPEIRPEQTPTAAGGLGSGVPIAKSRFEAPAGKITKRKSRTSKRAAATTFITADAANFRQMVQQVTGLRFGGLNPAAQVLKPQPLPLPPRAMNHMQDGGCLPTLDTSAFLLGQVGSTSSQSVELPAGNVPPSPSGAGGFEYDSVFSFPTLESWKAV
ncbi:calmodulin-binding protein 25-like [Olea europaea var. sylvestris]|uniref:calmodulin-binding protein 25-like n=1 Tax=Olea europaea var. sylvestris TaxID=158386 RepID=UPI000C1D3604|nr:calmodulin-binding protein 25-like [Olea europaea var. sylvestris]